MRESQNFKLKIFCDFDGTITKNDVWLNSLGRFIQDKEKLLEISRKFESGIITARECLKSELDLLVNFNFEEFNSYLDKEELDDHFKDFLNYCNENKIEVFIISEGLDYYIEYILNKENVKLPLYCNKAVKVLTNERYNGNKVYKLNCYFPHADEHCRLCGCSKRNVMLNNTNNIYGEVSVLIGDGASDYCASHYADIIFAKDNLASYCWKNNITYFDFQNFRDITNKLKKLIEQKKIKHRQSAETNRKNVFLGG